MLFMPQNFRSGSTGSLSSYSRERVEARNLALPPITQKGDLTLSNLNRMERYMNTFRRFKSSMGRSSGVDGIRLDDMSETEAARGFHLYQTAISNGSFRPNLHRVVQIPKANGQKRTLNLPVILERFIAKSLLLDMLRLGDEELPNEMHGYRIGRSTITMLSAIVDKMNAGMFYVVSADIRDAFPSIRRNSVSAALQKFIDDPGLRNLLLRMSFPGCDEFGLPQGLATSPLLFNLALSDGLKGLTLTRQDNIATFIYADNFVLVGSNRDLVEETLCSISGALKPMNLVFKESEPQIIKRASDGKITLFGHNLSLHNGGPRLSISRQGWEQLEEGLDRCIESPNPVAAFREFARGWREYYETAIRSYEPGHIESRIQKFSEILD